MISGTDYTANSPLWQALEYRKRCYRELAKRNFAANHDYDRIFNQIHKELHNGTTLTETDRQSDFETA